MSFRQRIIASDMDAGIAHLASSTKCDASDDDWRATVAQALAAGYVYDPVRLPAGALQCHWHLELTPKGVDEVRRLQSSTRDKT